MRTIKTIAVVAVAALALTACGGGDDSDEGGTEGQPGQASINNEPVTQGDVDALAVTLGAAWGVDCGDTLVDMAGYPKAVCPIPDDMMTPGVSSNAVAVQTFTEWEQAHDFEEQYVTEGVIEIRNGWFVHAPTQEIADSAVAALEE